MQELIQVIVKPPGELPEVRTIPNTLEALQEIVGGYIETVTVETDLVAIVNEEGRLMGLPYNVHLCGVPIVGPLIFAGVDGDEFCDVPDGVPELISFGR